MAWVLLIIAGLSEVFMAISLKNSKGFTELWPNLGFLVSAALSFGLLSLVIKELPVGTAYAVWTGIGAAGTAILGMVLLGEPVQLFKIAAITFIVVGVIGLQLSGAAH